MYPTAYIDFLVQFHSVRDYFECHEILEDHWKAAPPSERKKHWAGLIQLAVALYHERRQNIVGAERMMNRAEKIISEEKEPLKALAIDVEKLLLLIQQRKLDIHRGVRYQDINIPLTDSDLVTLCCRKSVELGAAWRSESDLSNSFLIHRHILRDRTDVVEEREAQRLIRKKKKLSGG
ncbi:DUF309 domain-containing protein [Alteribacillus sp. HJP-4]|uniref:DUF309 domain-containing protein n=1 Tax=Alteribacillus sp. HJP-4 TaxID=2775394 RepID=UPI0035CD0AC2